MISSLVLVVKSGFSFNLARVMEANPVLFPKVM